jgi:hypothetical protein
MDLAFDDMLVSLGLKRGRGHFLNFLGAPMIFYNTKGVFLAVNVSLRWLNNERCLFLLFRLTTTGV